MGEKPVVWLRGEVKTPPFSKAAPLEMGLLLRHLQRGESLGLPQSRPMPEIGARCHELRVRDQDKNWRLIYRLDDDAVLVAEVFAKATRETPSGILENCRRRLRRFDSDSKG